MFKKILLGLVLLVAILAVVVALQPSDFKITRSITINAPPERIFPLVNDFHQWARWSPWEALDPEMKRTFEGPESGVGSIYRWAGNSIAPASAALEVLVFVFDLHVRIQNAAADFFGFL